MDRKIILDILKPLKLKDDIFFNVFFTNFNEGLEILLHAIYGEDLIIIDSNPQLALENLEGKSTRFDVLAEDEEGNFYVIEIQLISYRNLPKRARFYGSQIDTQLLKKGQNYNEQKENNVIFIIEGDYFGKGKPVYRFSMLEEELHFPLKDGSHILFVNLLNDDDTELGQLMQDFCQADPENIQNKIFRKRAKELKEKKEGADSMCETIEQYIKEHPDLFFQEGKAEGIQEANQKIILSLFHSGMEPEEIANRLNYSLEDVKKYLVH